MRSTFERRLAMVHVLMVHRSSLDAPLTLHAKSSCIADNLNLVLFKDDERIVYKYLYGGRGLVLIKKSTSKKEQGVTMEDGELFCLESRALSRPFDKIK